MSNYDTGGDLKYILTFKTEEQQFADPTPSDGDGDQDDDGLTDDEEYQLSSDPWINGRASPLKKDIFVEVDWMTGHSMDWQAKTKVSTRFYNNPTGEEIWLYVDDGYLGGGDYVQHSDGDTITYGSRDGSYNDFGDYYDNHFDTEREDKFHYCLMADLVKVEGDYYGGYSNREYGGHFTVADGEWDDLEAGSCFMHELGHTLGLHGGDEVIGAGYFPGIDNDSFSFDEYPSVMNYNAPDDYYQYSDGNEGLNDHDDWEDIMTEMDDYL